MIHSGDTAISFLKDVIAKLEELQVQAALGKAEFFDKFEEIKKELKGRINTVKVEVNSILEKNKESLTKAKVRLEHLELQLALGKAETAEELKKQKHNLIAAIRDVKSIIAKD